MSDEKTKESKEAAKIVSVKVKAMRPFEHGGRVVSPGEIVEVDEAKATMLCQRVDGPFDFFGERIAGTRDHRRHNLARAERVS